MPEARITLLQLRRADGEDGPMYVAYDGIVYDVSLCPRWRSGLHEQQHFPAQDLSGEMADAPHGMEVFSRPCVRRVGVLELPPDRDIDKK
jgi:predicted heme/steroid binding protein